jgi:putative heme-binding domain-containing protein
MSSSPWETAWEGNGDVAFRWRLACGRMRLSFTGRIRTLAFGREPKILSGMQPPLAFQAASSCLHPDSPDAGTLEEWRLPGLGFHPPPSGSVFQILLAFLILLSDHCLGQHPPPPVPIPGWTLHLVAQAPDIQHPSVVTVAPDGRVFVAEDPMDIRSPANATEGRILCFHPDGRRIVFAEGLHAVFGMQYLEGHLYVLHNPRLTAFRDDNSIGRDPRDLIRQTNPNPWALDWNDHVPANFRLALDGFFYVAVGDKGLFGATGTDGRRVDLHGGGIVRIRPDGSGLEVFSTGVRNILDVARTEEDDLFTYDNTDENQWMGRVTHMIDGGFYGYPFDFIPQQPHTLWMLADYGAGAATGALAVTGDGIPEDWRGNLILADFGQRNLRRVVLERQAGSFRAVRDQMLLSNPPADFRPVGIAFSGDNAHLYICDWQHRDTKESAVTGRLWRLSQAAPPTPAPRPAWYLPVTLGRVAPASIPATNLLQALAHPAHPVRHAAQRALSQSGTNHIPALLRLLRDPHASDHARIHALWALHALNGASAIPAPDYDPILTTAPTPLLRQLLRQAGESGRSFPPQSLIPFLQHPDASIRLHAAVALGRCGSPAQVPALLQALNTPDLFPFHATFTALNRIGRRHPSAWDQIAHALGQTDPRIREGARFAMRETWDTNLVAALCKAATNTAVVRAARTNAIGLLSQIRLQPPPWDGSWWAYHPFRLQRPARTQTWAATEQIQLLFLNLLGGSPVPILRQLALEALGQTPDPALGLQVAARFGKEPDANLRRAYLRTLARLQVPDAGIIGLDLARKSPLAERLDPSLTDLLQSTNDTSTANALLDLAADHPSATRSAHLVELAGQIGRSNLVTRLAALTRNPDSPLLLPAIRALGLTGDPAAAPALAEQLASGSPAVRSAALAALVPLRSTAAIPALVQAASDPSLKPMAVEGLLQTPDLRALDLYLEALESRSAAGRAAARQALHRIHTDALPRILQRLPKLTPPAIAELQSVYRTHRTPDTAALFAIETPRPTREAFFDHALANRGDSAKGKRIFEDRTGVACIQCHRVQGQGTDIGPDLSGVGAQFDRRTLAESILWPNRAVREGYALTRFELTDGDEILGMIRAETTDSISLQPAAGEPLLLPKSRIRSRQPTSQSLMPEGLEGALSLDDFADLLAYLESLRSGT